MSEIVKDAQSLYEIYYHSNGSHRGDRFDYRGRIDDMNRKINIDSYLVDSDIEKNILESERFYQGVQAGGPQRLQELARLAEQENKLLLDIYNKKLDEVVRMIANIKIAPMKNANGTTMNPINNRDSDFQVITKTINDAIRNSEKDH